MIKKNMSELNVEKTDKMSFKAMRIDLTKEGRFLMTYEEFDENMSLVVHFLGVPYYSAVEECMSDMLDLFSAVGDYYWKISENGIDKIKDGEQNE